MPWQQIEPVYDESVRNLCPRPYPGHPRGCPNYGKRATCPPKAPLLFEFFDYNSLLYVVWDRFDIGDHAREMLRKHPNWSERQAYCCLYWQPRARRELRDEIARSIREIPIRPLVVTACPEAMGVNVTATMKLCGIDLEWPPREWAYQVALIGKPYREIGPCKR